MTILKLYDYDGTNEADILYEYEAYGESYQFDLLILVKDKQDGKLYVATDSGCSCPVPFEDHTYPTDYIEVRSWADVKRELDNAFPIGTSSYRGSRLPHDGLRRAVQKATR